MDPYWISSKVFVQAAESDLSPYPVIVVTELTVSGH